MSDTEKPSWEWRALAMARDREMGEELATWRVWAQDLQTANEWLAKRVDELIRQREEEVAEWKDKARWKHTHDDSLELELKKQLATVTQERDVFELKYELVRHECCELRHVAERQLDATTANLEAQRTATYQAVAREHAAKAQLALAQKGQP